MTNDAFFEPHVRSGSWLRENARTLRGDRTSYSLTTVFAVKRASALNLENELKNAILPEFRSFAFLHSQGHSRPVVLLAGSVSAREPTWLRYVI